METAETHSGTRRPARTLVAMMRAGRRLLSALAAGALLALATPSAQAGEAQPDCGLQNRVFCGQWLYYGKQGGGHLTIHGTRWTWESGDAADCTVLTEEQRKGRIYSVFRCVFHWHDGTSSDGRLLMLSLHDRVRRDQIYRMLYLTDNSFLPCLFAYWEQETYQELRRAYGCGYGVTKYEAPYSGWPVGASPPVR